MFIDSHAHLDSPRLGSGLDDLLARAADARVESIMNIACLGENPETAQTALGLVERYPRVSTAAGVHPHDARLWSQALAEELLDLMKHPKVLGWGEIGLDFHYDNSPRPVQEDVFRRQLILARESGKPVIIHSRQAAEETYRILEEEFCGEGSPGGVMHCFAYDQTAAEFFLKLGFYLSFGGIVTFPRARELRDVARQVPAERFLIETDSPYLAPVPFRGKPNEPAYVTRVAEKLAEVRNTTVEAVAAESRRNFIRLFRVEKEAVVCKGCEGSG